MVVLLNDIIKHELEMEKLSRLEPQMNADTLTSYGVECLLYLKGVQVTQIGWIVGNYYADIIVEDEVIAEIKTVKEFDLIPMAHCLNYLRITGLKLCLLINFGKLKLDIKKIVNNL